MELGAVIWRPTTYWDYPEPYPGVTRVAGTLTPLFSIIKASIAHTWYIVPYATIHGLSIIKKTYEKTIQIVTGALIGFIVLFILYNSIPATTQICTSLNTKIDTAITNLAPISANLSTVHLTTAGALWLSKNPPRPEPILEQCALVNVLHSYHPMTEEIAAVQETMQNTKNIMWMIPHAAAIFPWSVVFPIDPISEYYLKNKLLPTHVAKTNCSERMTQARSVRYLQAQGYNSSSDLAHWDQYLHWQDKKIIRQRLQF